MTNPNLDEAVVFGIDLGDKKSVICALDARSEVVATFSVSTTAASLARTFSGLGSRRIVVEVGGHSPWVSRCLAGLGHEVIVANARRIALISKSSKKCDRRDAEMLARLAMVDTKLLSPIRHRSVDVQRDLLVLRTRDELVRTRTGLINHVRGVVKSEGGRLPSCSSEAFPAKASLAIPECLREGLIPILEVITTVSQKIAQLEKQAERLANEKYPETARLRQVSGVGTVTALSFVLTIDDKTRFTKSRSVGAYIGLTRKLSDSASRESQLGISKEGDKTLRRLLVNAAHYIVGPHGPDTDLRRKGLELCARGGKNAKKRAVVAIARKLAVLLHRLWVTGEPYRALREAA